LLIEVVEEEFMEKIKKSEAKYDEIVKVVEEMINGRLRMSYY